MFDENLREEAHQLLSEVLEENPECAREIQMEACREMMESVMEDCMKVFEFGATKHPDSGMTPNFLIPAGNKCSRRVRGNSCLHHAAELRAGETEDHESGLHPALHLITSAAILYYREQKGIVHPDDE